MDFRNFKRIGLTLAVIVIIGTACSSGGDPQASGHSAPQAGSGLSGVHERDLTVADLVQRADLVVVGRPVSDTVKPFKSNPAIPKRFHDSVEYQQGSYHDFKVEVTRRIKGTSPDTLTVPQAAAGSGLDVEGGLPTPVVGQEQVLILFKGGGVWSGGWLLFHGGVGLRDGDVWQFGEAIGRGTATDAKLAAWAKLPPYVPPTGGIKLEEAPMYP